MSNTNTSSYRSIFKATSLFGGVQLYQILILVAKSKIIAVLLGPMGVGVLGLYQSALGIVQSISNLGLASSAVRDVSAAYAKSDSKQASYVVSIIRKLVWITGNVGCAAVAITAPVLSKLSFGSHDYTIPFIILSLTLLFDQLCSGQKVLLQGTRRLKDLAKCSAIGSTCGFVLSIPFYYTYGINGIVPTLVLTSVCNLFVSWIYSNKVKIESVSVGLKESIQRGSLMIKMGLAISFSNILYTLASFVIRSYIQSESGIEMVGLYQAGFLIMNTYVSMVFNAITTDFYPRLSAVNNDNDKCRDVVCQQGEIAVLILAPLLSLCILFMPFVLKLLYSDQFIQAYEYILYTCVGMMFKLLAWLLGHLFLAKAESKMYFINEFMAMTYYLVFSLVGFKFWGLSGLGIAFAMNYLVYFIQVYLIVHKKFNFKFSSQFLKYYGVLLFLTIMSLVIVTSFDGVIRYITGCLLSVIITCISLYGFNAKMNIITYLRSKK